MIGPELGLDALAVALGALVGAHEVHDRLRRLAAAASRDVGLPVGVRNRKARQSLGNRARRG